MYPKLRELLHIWQFGDAPDNARELLRRATTEHHIPSDIATEMCENLTVIDPKALRPGRWVSGDKNAFFFQLDNKSTGIYKRYFDHENCKMLFRDISVFLKLRALQQGGKIPRLLLYGVVQGYGTPEVFMITEHCGESREPRPDDVLELEVILKEVHSHGILLSGLPRVATSEEGLVLADLSMARFEDQEMFHHQELAAILGSII